jgi:hypothetical protein
VLQSPLQENGPPKKNNMGNISAILVPPDQLTSEEKRVAQQADQNELRVLLDLARKEYDRLETSPREFYLVLANPPSVSLPEEEVDRLMQNLGSTKEISGSWLPTVVQARDHFFRVWGKTTYCG